VLVAGAGPAGSLAALLLARAGLRVTLIDRARFPRSKLCGDTVNPGARRLLASCGCIAPIDAAARRIDGMLLTGPGGIHVRAAYGPGHAGLALTRRELDALLVEQALEAGARLEDETTVVRAATRARDGVRGLVVRARGGGLCTRQADLVIAADGRASRLAREAGLVRPARWRRWAIGAYFEGVDGTDSYGEMHVRPGAYIGIAPLSGGMTNVCLVPTHGARMAWRDPALVLQSALTADPCLAPRFTRARLLDAPRVLGPLAVETTGAGVDGMLLAGDAAGFVDPMTGDGLRFAIEGAMLAAEVAQEVLGGAIARESAAAILAWRRRRAFGGKHRVNRALRRLVASPRAVAGAAHVARVCPQVFERLVRYAGDCR
jgi:geranylgeranyl reductase family protein